MLILLVTGLTVGHYLVFRLFQNRLREDFVERLMQSGQALETFGQEEAATFLWEKKNKEFYYQGKLYDVIRVNGHGKDRKFLCIADEEEHLLKKKFSRLTGPDALKAGKKYDRLSQLLFSFYFFCGTVDLLPALTEEVLTEKEEPGAPLQSYIKDLLRPPCPALHF